MLTTIIGVAVIIWRSSLSHWIWCRCGRETLFRKFQRSQSVSGFKRSGHWLGDPSFLPQEQANSMRSSPLEVPTGLNSRNSVLFLDQSPSKKGSPLSPPRREHDCVLTVATQMLAAASAPALPLTSPCGASLWLATATALLSKLVVRRLQ